MEEILTKQFAHSESHETFSITDHTLRHKEGLNGYKKIEIINCILSDHHALKLDINNHRNINLPSQEYEQLTTKRILGQERN